MALSNLFTNLLGSKAKRDLKELNVFEEPLRESYEVICKLSTDELRTKTLEFKKRIKEHVAEEQNEIDDLKKQIDEDYDMDVDEKERKCEVGR